MSENKGLFEKYIITRTDGKPLSPGRRFVLSLDSSDPQEARAVKAAMITYVMFIRSHNPLLAEELKKRGYTTGYEPNVERKAMQERIAELEESLIKASVRADFFGDCMNNLDITTEADEAAGDPLFEEVNPVLESITDEKKRYKAHYDAALARWKAVDAEENEK